ncbi:hypothetical protein ABFS83_08G036800 [Erythranthe nasuta]
MNKEMIPKAEGPAAVAAAPAGGGTRWWNSPFTFIFSGLALMLGIIPVVLMLVACSYIRSSDQSSSNDDSNENSELRAFQPEMEPGVVVIMAGEKNPTHLAKPVAAAVRTQSDRV